MDKYFVIGNPINQSKSPEIHRQFAKQTMQQLAYDKLLVEPEQLLTTLSTLKAEGVKGINVTVPFKERVIGFCDQVSNRASAAGAVNTIWFKENGSVFGDNTDGAGLVSDLLSHKIELENKKVLIIGAGGATRGVILPILEQQVHSICIANRTLSKAKSLVEQFAQKRVTACALEELLDQQFDLIINATSASLSGSLPAINGGILTDAVCYDMVYGQGKTSFLRFAEQHGASQVIDGLGMLVGQAAVSFNLWRGVMPETISVINQLRAQLAAQ